MTIELTPLALTYYLLIGAGVVTLLMAILNVGNATRAAGLVCLAVAIAVVGLIVQGNDNKMMLYIAGFSLLAAITLMGGYIGGGSRGAGGHGDGAGEHH
ncbi:MAG: hypothetical protein K8S25_03895 [Alphaproteobacteria bacterium]|nr:hypothetical protein [Alphaproteobacteria bacterium]